MTSPETGPFKLCETSHHGGGLPVPAESTRCLCAEYLGIFLFHGVIDARNFMLPEDFMAHLESQNHGEAAPQLRSPDSHEGFVAHRPEMFARCVQPTTIGLVRTSSLAILAPFPFAAYFGRCLEAEGSWR